MKWIFLLASVVVSACAEIGLEPAGVPAPPPPRPVLREPRAPSATFGASLIARRDVSGLKLEVLTVGYGRVQGSLLSELKSPASQLAPPVLVFLVRHPNKGILLFGSGLPEDLEGLGSRRVTGSALAPFRVTAGRDLASQLDQRKVRAEEIKAVILPDLAPEWAGRAGAFPSAEVIVSSRAWFDSRRRPLEANLPNPRAFVPEERLRLVDPSTARPYGPFDHGVDLFSDGSVILIDLDGGAAGGLGLWLNLDSGPVLLTGPAAFVYDNVFDNALPDRRFVVDISSFAWNARAMTLAQEAVPRLVIVPAHDLSTLKLSPRPDIVVVP